VLAHLEDRFLKITQQYSSHIPIPYSCMTVVVLVLSAMAVLAVSSFAIATAILK
jgi:hypothetical protein